MPAWKNKTAPHGRRLLVTGGGGRNRTGVHGFAGRCITTLPPRQVTMLDCIRIRCGRCIDISTPAHNSEAIPRKKKGSVASLWDWSGRRVSNSRPQPWQGCALPTELLPRTTFTAWQTCCRSADLTDTPSRQRMPLTWSGRRVSNSRPQPWQGCALPTELLPQGPASYRKADYRATSFNYAALCWQFALTVAYLAAFVFVVSSENEIIAKDEPARQQLSSLNLIFARAPRLVHRCARGSVAMRASCNRTSTTA